MLSPVLVLIDPVSGRHRLCDPAEPVVRADEIGYLRGDGVFETLAVIDGGSQALQEHLSRLRDSAAAISLPVPDDAVWLAAIRTALDAHEPHADLTVRLVASYNSSGAPTRCLVRVEPTLDSRHLREAGIGVSVLDRGYARGATEQAPWLLAGVKSTSGAVTRAALREAHRRGTDDVIWRSSDGWLLEGATSSLVLSADGVLLTPASEAGILDGTTVTRILSIGASLGLGSARAWLRMESLFAADAAWLVSSTRRAVPIRHVDEQPLAIDHGLTEAFEQGLLRGGF